MMTTKRWISSLMAAALCLSLLVAPAGAYTRVDVSQPVSLSLSYQNEGEGVEGLELSLYKVYDMDDAVRFQPCADFQTQYGGEIKLGLDEWTDVVDGKNVVDWTGLATNLELLLQRDSAAPKVQPLLTGTTDANGQITFASTPDVNMTPGLYLVMGATLVKGNYIYTPQTFLVSLPHLNDDDTWQYNLVANGKMDAIYNPPGGGGNTISVTVVKVWEDADAGEDVVRPASIQVQLLRNGSVYKTATLNEGNGWKYTWNRLSENANWAVVEESVPDGYTMEITQTGYDYVITNYADTEIEEEDPPLDPGPGPDEDPGEDPGDLPDVDLPDEEVPMEGLPQTGTLWWPVQALTAAGILLFSIGWLDLRRGRKQSHEE